MKIMMVGDIVGGPGRAIFAEVSAKLKHSGQVDFIVVNAENAAGGRGITDKLADELLANGADVITLGDHTWDQKEIKGYLDREMRIIRPANFTPECPGNGWTTVNTSFGPVTVINLVGRVFMHHYDCPFRTSDGILKRPDLGKTILVDIHAEATAEKIVLGRYLDGRVTAVVGTHTHVQTSDEQILPNGTAYITDLGMTGPKDSAIGRDLESVTSTFLTGMPAKFHIAAGQVMLEGVIIDVDRETGKARTIKRIRLKSDRAQSTVEE
ncbi:MAG: TIGR00282 family metallophosphoesterase [Kiritimatiellae bacterium]|nr:TIGR00282 family metallophosphoesterase [Kiritimatiellia bacterium]MDD5519975.1 TIGR00282 family metallophosphoesterase [Kiritimatiellia bacterium]